MQGKKGEANCAAAQSQFCGVLSLRSWPACGHGVCAGAAMSFAARAGGGELAENDSARDRELAVHRRR